MVSSARRWNHNIHYHRLILDAVPAGSRTALDVGCGNGLLSVELREAVPEVTGIDLDQTVLEDARQHSDEITWVRGDAMTCDFGKTFDVVASVATLHHLPDLDTALSRLADLTSPGGVLAVVGVARTSRPKDVLLHLAGAVQHR
ncbi:class I SAM-dependent methyltransferase [Propionibacterium freudenreichii]|uniref:class I SAM-dependent methyltransferase n=1 Tax=Propionibacterium freudenreichii TaxID=1744 RepID=UPI000542A65A|nr:class I SAM-dependent methyltransferase [Propionibacterium freudenreichii]CEG94931.1 Methylase involved in ubiquinone/menaquinone biosynthesis [Propionibacterium freudenreichii]CEG99715.1 Methylase involved in ubiquinone/menaquinone biosynthesis [Propionibacterium freudenreichii]CEH03566.1 Methylase involved in ubiquinone/menaquinone biosynthesis [Propionibacterium freudenreichii]CEI23092.1 Methylase involved in ubiquinone/menaquinone biosynthesis [Propionibacterium freudenreichii]CEI24611.